MKPIMHIYRLLSDMCNSVLLISVVGCSHFTSPRLDMLFIFMLLLQIPTAIFYVTVSYVNTAGSYRSAMKVMIIRPFLILAFDILNFFYPSDEVKPYKHHLFHISQDVVSPDLIVLLFNS